MNSSCFKYRHMALAYLDRVGEKGVSIRTSDIAKALGKSPSQTSVYMRQLESLGFVLRNKDKSWRIHTDAREQYQDWFNKAISIGHAGWRDDTITVMGRIEAIGVMA